MGIVTLFRPPYKSKGTDFTCTFEIVDEGCASSPFPLIFFNRDVNKLPRSCSVGDVLCVRRVDVSEFNQRLQGKCRHFCSWLVWGGGKGEGRREPSRTSDGTTWDPDEKNRADQLIRWSTSLNFGQLRIQKHVKYADCIIQCQLYKQLQLKGPWLIEHLLLWVQCT